MNTVNDHHFLNLGVCFIIVTNEGQAPCNPHGSIKQYETSMGLKVHDTKTVMRVLGLKQHKTHGVGCYYDVCISNTVLLS
jgi:hypothetical protein